MSSDPCHGSVLLIIDLRQRIAISFEMKICFERVQKAAPPG